jgi:hypothetical protein
MDISFSLHKCVFELTLLFSLFVPIKNVCPPSSKAVGMARLGQPTQKIVYGTLEELSRVDFGGPLHCMALCGELHPLELEILQYFEVKPEDIMVEKDEEEDPDKSDSEPDL